MKVTVDNVDFFTLTDIQKKVIANDIPTEFLEDDLKRRLKYIIMHKYEECFKRLKQEWDSKLAANGIASIPTNPDAYAQLVFAQPNYKNRSQRDANAQEK